MQNKKREEEPARFSANIFVAAALLSQLGLALTRVAIITIAATHFGATAAVTLWVAMNVGTVTSGFLIPFVVQPRIGFFAIFIVALGKIALLLGSLFALTYVDFFPFLVACQFSLSCLDGLLNPLKYFYLNRVAVDVKQREIIINRLQSYEGAASTVAPAIVAVLSFFLEIWFCLYLDVIFLSVVAAYWAWQLRRHCPDIHRNRRSSPLGGFIQILQSPKLRRLTSARLLGPLMGTFWAALIPTLLLEMIPTADYARYYGLCLAISASGMVFGSHIILQFMKSNASGKLIMLGIIAGIASCCAGIFMIMSLVELHVFYILLVCSLLGISTAAARTLVVSIGQRISPPESLHLIIAAGDSISRVWAAVFSTLCGGFIGAYQISQVPLAIAIGLITLVSIYGIFLIPDLNEPIQNYSS